MPDCLIDGCSYPAAVRGWCHSHYSRWQRKGDPLAGGPLRRKADGPRVCIVDGCGKQHHSGGWCSMHHMRVRTTGSPGGPEYRRTPGSPGRTEKACTVCKAVKPLSDFYTDKRTRDGVGSQCRECMRVPHKERAIRRKYGLTPEQYQDMVDRQHGACPICHEHRPLVVDHCHRTGKVRALLCDRCNRLLGVADDDPSLLKNALAFLREHSE